MVKSNYSIYGAAYLACPMQKGLWGLYITRLHLVSWIHGVNISLRMYLPSRISLAKDRLRIGSVHV